MPIGVGPRGLWEQTVTAFERGFGGLTRNAYGPYESEKGPWMRPAAGQQTTLTIPGWDSTIKLGAPDPNDPGTREANRAIARAIHDSASPDYANSFGEIMTGVDNIRDTIAA